MSKKSDDIPGARARTDQAFLAQAIAINAALTGRQAALLPPDPITVMTGTRTITGNRTAERTDTGSESSKSSNSDDKDKTTNGKENKTDGKIVEKTGDDSKQTFETKQPPVVDIPTDAKIPADFETFTNSAVNVKRNDPTIEKLPGFGDGGLHLEPSIILDEKKRFLDHLNQIRRVNEGDDTADSPGYALYLRASAGFRSAGEAYRYRPRRGNHDVHQSDTRRRPVAGHVPQSRCQRHRRSVQ